MIMSTFGTLFRVSTFGESHCPAVGCIVDGVPPRLPFDASIPQCQLSRRRPGQSSLTTQRQEDDFVEILAGIEAGVTLGTPIALMVRNKDQRPGDYGGQMTDVPRPSHADYTYQEKYGVRATSGGGRASARETIGRVAAGAIAEHWLTYMYEKLKIVAYVSAVGKIVAPKQYETDEKLSREMVDKNVVRCPHQETAQNFIQAIEQAKAEKDSLGGVITCVVKNAPKGIGEPVFDKLEAMLAHAMLSIPSTKGFEIGSGFEGTKERGSKHNDRFVKKNGQIRTETNKSGGIQGGITNGEDIVFRVAFKPPATIGIQQNSVDFDGNDSTITSTGRHDPCVLPRAVPIVEAMTALVLADAVLIQQSRMAASQPFAMIGRINPHELYANSKLTESWNSTEHKK